MRTRTATLKADYKVPGGKMIRITLKVDGNIISTVKITGDFFMHPEEFIEQLETILKGVKIEEPNLTKCIDEVFLKNRIEVIGTSAQDFSKAILRAAENISDTVVG